MREARISGPPHNPGSGGWPTLRYFNKETGLKGKTYKQRTGLAVCDEMKIQVNMNDYVEEQGGTYLCSAFDGSMCDSVELAMINELSNDPSKDYPEQLKAIEAADVTMTDNLEKRKKLLKQLIAKAEVQEEL